MKLLIINILFLLIALKAFAVLGGNCSVADYWGVCNVEKNGPIILENDCERLLLCYKSKFATGRNSKVGRRFRSKIGMNGDGLFAKCSEVMESERWHALIIDKMSDGKVAFESSLRFGGFFGNELINETRTNTEIQIFSNADGLLEKDFQTELYLGAFMDDFNGMALQILAFDLLSSIGPNGTELCKKMKHPVDERWRLENELNIGIRQAINPPSINSARISIHEAGHVLCSYNNPKFIETLNYTTIIEENTYVGVTYFMPRKQYDWYSVNELKAMMSTFLCGKVAEEIMLQLSLKHGNDIIRADEIASQLAKRLNYGEPRRIINQEKTILLDEATTTASNLLLQRPPDLKKLASHLLNKKTLNNRDVSRRQSVIRIIVANISVLGRGPRARQLTTQFFGILGITAM